MPKSAPEQIRDLFRPYSNKLKLMIGRAIVNLIDDAGKLQLVQADRLADETGDDIERFAEYGFTSNPPPGAEGIVLSVGGVRSHGVMIACEHRQYRLAGLQTGEAALYDDQGQVVYLTREGIRISSSLKIDIEAPEVTLTTNVFTVDADETNLTGTLSIGGDLDVTGASTLGEGASKFVKLADNSNATKVKAL